MGRERNIRITVEEIQMKTTKMGNLVWLEFPSSCSNNDRDGPLFVSFDLDSDPDGFPLRLCLRIASKGNNCRPKMSPKI